MIKTKYWLSILAVSAVLLTGTLAISPTAIADDLELECIECDRRLGELVDENIEKHAKCIIDAEEDTDKLIECDDKYGPTGEEVSKARDEYDVCVGKFLCLA